MASEFRDSDFPASDFQAPDFQTPDLQTCVVMEAAMRQMLVRHGHLDASHLHGAGAAAQAEPCAPGAARRALGGIETGPGQDRHDAGAAASLVKLCGDFPALLGTPREWSPLGIAAQRALLGDAGTGRPAPVGAAALAARCDALAQALEARGILEPGELERGVDSLRAILAGPFTGAEARVIALSNALFTRAICSPVELAEAMTGIRRAGAGAKD